MTSMTSMTDKVIIFDTETNGLPKSYKKGGLEAPNNWPDIVSICWMLFSGGKLLWKEYHIVRPDGWTVNEESTAIHGITHEFAERVGRPLAEVLAAFRRDVTGCRRLVAHNLNFDMNVMLSAYKWRLQEDPTVWWPSPEAQLCTMLKATDELKIPNPHGYASYKWPKLDELWTATFGTEPPADAHSADRDVDVLQKIYWTRYDVLKKPVQRRSWCNYCVFQ